MRAKSGRFPHLSARTPKLPVRTERPYRPQFRNGYRDGSDATLAFLTGETMVTYIRSDLDFILEQIKIAEEHAAGEPLFGADGLIPANNISWGLRTVDGTYNNLIPGRTDWGAADQPFPNLLDPVYRPAPETVDMNGPGAAVGVVGGGTYEPTPNQPGAIVVDSAPRTISNLIVDSRPSTRPRWRRRSTSRASRAARPMPSRTSRPRSMSTAPRPVIPLERSRGPAGRGHGARPRDGRREPGHAERLARRGPVGVVQLVVHALRPVLRPRPRPRRQGAERHRLHPAAAGRSALRRRAARPTSWC